MLRRLWDRVDATPPTQRHRPGNSRSNSSTNVALAGATSTSSGTTNSERKPEPTIKQLGLRFVHERLHWLLSFCRALSVIPSVLGLWNCVYEGLRLGIDAPQHQINSVRSSELFLAGIWCVVSGYLSYSVTDGLMVRWIVTYSSPAAILRVLSCSMLNIAITQALHSLLSPDRTYLLHIWILVSCILTVAYIIQNFVTSNLSLEKRGRRYLDLYHIAVFAVVPVGLASFVTMLGLLRSLLILRLDLEQRFDMNFF